MAPPRIDIRNRNIVRAQGHAIWMEVAKPDFGKTLTTVLDLTPADGKIPLSVKDAPLARGLKNPAYRAAALTKVNQLVTSIRDELVTTRGFMRAGLRRSSTRSSGLSIPPANACAASIAQPSASASCITG